uniref:Uncharacterized protein LOC105084016 n=1 Tax=Camelus bactrianus TaxID=9837 RepID=A0A9W3FRQ8_CAMBA|nr:uncharacterized protein LOC105084016 [Camelus bactrianus]
MQTDAQEVGEEETGLFNPPISEGEHSNQLGFNSGLRRAPIASWLMQTDAQEVDEEETATAPGRSGRAREGPGPEALEVGGAMWGRDPESLELGRNRPHPSTPLGSVQSLARLLTPGRPYRPFQEHLSEGHLRASYRAILNLADSANCCMMVLHTECMLISPLHCHHIPIIWRATGQECPSLERKPSFFAKPGHSLPLGSATEVVQPLISQCPQNTLTEGTDTFQALYKIPRKPMEAFWHELKKHLPSPPSWRSY